jgi:2,4-dienoyl-CoA reductase-like NADH-dependent reductase (Old Yellow Enzyme family)
MAKHRLLEPATLGPVALRNRVIMAPMTTRQADDEGHVTPGALAYYAARAAGGVGLVTVEMAAPERVGKHRRNELGLYDDRFLPGLRDLVRTIHAGGAKASIQIGHGGGHTRVDICGETPIAPSAVPHSVQEGHTEVIVPEAMTTDRIRRTMEAFVGAAVRARTAGFDAVEIHAAHGYLISQFLAPGENIRTDAYGGSLVNRARFGLEMLSAVKAAVPELAVVFRMNGDDFFAGGIGLDEAVQVAVWAAERGADAIHMTGGHYRSQPSASIMIPPMATERTPFLGFARAVKARVDVPVIAVGRLGDPADAIAALDTGAADFVALGRPLLADADWLRKVAAGEQVRRCLACNTCVDGMRTGSTLHCLVNPLTGREVAYAGREPVRRGQKIAVIGGGPAGLTYAAAMAVGNTVVVFERDRRLGGGFRWAGLAPKFQTVEARTATFEAYIEALQRACATRGVTFRLGEDPVATPSMLSGFDHVVVATGAAYPVGTRGIVEAALTSGLARRGALRRLMADDRMRDYFYRRFRRATGEDVRRRIKAPSVEVIGDARQAGKSDAAILDAFRAAYGPEDLRETKPVRSLAS